jgi:hypothetical protein
MKKKKLLITLLIEIFFLNKLQVIPVVLEKSKNFLFEIKVVFYCDL